jgi:hypothetical protein
MQGSIRTAFADALVYVNAHESVPYYTSQMYVNARKEMRHTVSQLLVPPIQHVL